LPLEAGDLEGVEARLFALRAMGRKLNCDPDLLDVQRNDLAERLDLIEAGEAGIEAARKVERAAEARWHSAAHALTAARRAAASRLEAAIAAELAPLKLGRATIRVALIPLPEAEAGAGGAERAEFEAETNSGAGFGPLRKVASGGETRPGFSGPQVRACRSGQRGDAHIRRSGPGRRRRSSGCHWGEAGPPVWRAAGAGCHTQPSGRTRQPSPTRKVRHGTPDFVEPHPPLPRPAADARWPSPPSPRSTACPARSATRRAGSCAAPRAATAATGEDVTANVRTIADIPGACGPTRPAVSRCAARSTWSHADFAALNATRGPRASRPSPIRATPPPGAAPARQPHHRQAPLRFFAYAWGEAEPPVAGTQGARLERLRGAGVPTNPLVERCDTRPGCSPTTSRIGARRRSATTSTASSTRSTTRLQQRLGFVSPLAALGDRAQVPGRAGLTTVLRASTSRSAAPAR
jgi:hypothetical protein